MSQSSHSALQAFSLTTATGSLSTMPLWSGAATTCLLHQQYRETLVNPCSHKHFKDNNTSAGEATKSSSEKCINTNPGTAMLPFTGSPLWDCCPAPCLPDCPLQHLCPQAHPYHMNLPYGTGWLGWCASAGQWMPKRGFLLREIRLRSDRCHLLTAWVTLVFNKLQKSSISWGGPWEPIHFNTSLPSRSLCVEERVRIMYLLVQLGWFFLSSLFTNCWFTWDTLLKSFPTFLLPSFNSNTEEAAEKCSQTWWKLMLRLLSTCPKCLPVIILRSRTPHYGQQQTPCSSSSSPVSPVLPPSLLEIMYIPRVQSKTTPLQINTLPLNHHRPQSPNQLVLP